MGRFKDQMIDDQHERAHQKRLEKIAEHYGFDVSEIDGLDVGIHAQTGNNDFHYGWYIELPDDAPQHIKDLVEDGNLPLHFFDEQEESDLPEDGRPTFGDMNTGFAKGLADEMRRRNNPDAEDNTGK